VSPTSLLTDRTAQLLCVRIMNQSFWKGLGGGGDPFWLHREALNFKDCAAYQNIAVFQTGVNTKVPQTSTHYATPLWVVRQFKWLTVLPIYGSFGVKGLSIGMTSLWVIVASARSGLREE
jgi:hypothetical protein